MDGFGRFECTAMNEEGPSYKSVSEGRDHGGTNYSLFMSKKSKIG